MLNFKKNQTPLRLSKAVMLSSALPLIIAATSSTAFAQTAQNTASVAVPANVVDNVTANNSATDSDTIRSIITADNEMVTTPVDTSSDVLGVVNVLTGDMLNGVQIDAGDVTLSSTDIPTGFTLNEDGSVDVAANMPSGTYTFTYKVCEDGVTPENCAIATVEITVDGPITADADTVTTPVNTSTAQTNVINVLPGDMLNGVQALIADITIVPVGTLPTGITLNADGSVDVAANTPSGNYSFDYKICEDGVTPENCATATVIVPVVGPITADNEVVSAPIDTTTAQTGVINVLTGDTLNGIAIDAGDVTLSSTDIPDGFTLNQDGTVDVAANTPSGTYTFTYKVCEDGVSPENCATATVEITVDGPIAADDETVTAPVDTSTAQTNVINVLPGDMLNGVQALIADVTIVPVGTLPAGITLNADGSVDVAANTPSGTYMFDYKICEDGVTPENCATATVTIPVVGPITADNEVVTTPVDTTTAQTNVINVLPGDMLNGVQALIADVTIVDLDAAIANAVQQGADTIVTLDADTTVTLEGLLLADLDSTDFVAAPSMMASASEEDVFQSLEVEDAPVFEAIADDTGSEFFFEDESNIGLEDDFVPFIPDMFEVA